MMNQYGIIEIFARNSSDYMDIRPYSLYLRDFFSLSLARCMEEVGAQKGSLFLVDESNKELVLEVARGSEHLFDEGLRESIGDRIAGQVALERRPCLVRDIEREPRFSVSPRYEHYRTKSFLSVPLQFDGDLIGVLNITDKKGDDIFDDKDLKIVVNICNSLGIALFSLRNYLQKQHQQYQQLLNEMNELRKTNEQSQKYSSLGKLVGGLVHEVNNPLDGVMRYVRLASDYIEEDGPVKDYLQQARVGLGRIAKIIRSLLDFSWSLSPSAGKIDINATIDESLFMFSHKLVAYNVEVKKEFSSDLPEIPDLRLKLVFNNLVKNACEAMKSGGALLISTASVDKMIEIRFQDTGPGVPQEIREKVFEPFFTTKNIGEGSGLGLSMTYEVIKRYKGNIFIKDAPGSGAVFVIQLPISP